MVLHDEYVNFAGCHPALSGCRVRIYATSEDEYFEIYQRGPLDDDHRRIYVLLTQSGYDMTRALISPCDIVAGRIVESLGLHPARLVVIQHYDYRRWSEDRKCLYNLETFSRIEFDRSEFRPSGDGTIARMGSPTWHSMGKEEVERLIGTDLD